MKNMFMKVGLLALSILFTFFVIPLEVQSRAPREVNCNEGETIQAELDKALDGDIIGVFRSCSENVVIEHDRITLTAVGGATLNGPDSTMPTIRVIGQNAIIENFASISSNGTFTSRGNVVQVGQGGSAEIRSNTIKEGRRGVLCNQGTYCRIIGNIIRDHNGNDGITVSQASSAGILNNTIHNNFGRGVRVMGGSAADIDNNTITNNGSAGILVTRNSFVRLSGDPSSGLPNMIEGNVRGVRCRENSSIRSNVAQDFGTTGNPPADVDTADPSCTTGGGI